MNEVNTSGAIRDIRASLNRFNQKVDETSDVIYWGLRHSFGDDVWLEKLSEFLRSINVSEPVINELLALETHSGTRLFRRRLTFIICPNHQEALQKWLQAEYDKEFAIAA